MEGLEGAVEAVLVPSNEMPEDAVEVTGPQVKEGLKEVLAAYYTTGYQATNYGVAVEEVKAMLKWRMCDDEVALRTARQHQEITDDEAKDIRTKVFLGVTSALLLGGVREAITFLCKHKMVHVVVTPGGGLDSDILRTINPEYVTIGDYNASKDGAARHGNVNVHPSAREKVVAFVLELLPKLVASSGLLWTPSALTKEIGLALTETSALYWCAKNGIPVYSPSIVDGWVGEAIFEFNEAREAKGEEPLRVDLVVDVKQMNCEATTAKHTGMIILGGGLVKHHICNANLMRNGADHSIFIGTGQEFDGSDAGARPDEAVSWGKIRPGTRPVKVYADASYIFPLLVAHAFVPYFQSAPKGLYP